MASERLVQSHSLWHNVTEMQVLLPFPSAISTTGAMVTNGAYDPQNVMNDRDQNRKKPEKVGG